jgi:hypothetical protein
MYSAPLAHGRSCAAMRADAMRVLAIFGAFWRTRLIIAFIGRPSAGQFRKRAPAAAKTRKN